MLSERLMEQCKQYHKTDRGRLIEQYREQVSICNEFEICACTVHLHFSFISLLFSLSFSCLSLSSPVEGITVYYTRFETGRG